jgi:hypothetical protein
MGAVLLAALAMPFGFRFRRCRIKRRDAANTNVYLSVEAGLLLA